MEPEASEREEINDHHAGTGRATDDVTTCCDPHLMQPPTFTPILMVTKS